MRNYLNLPLSKPRTRYGMAEYLKNHPGRSDNPFSGAPIRFSRNVKISHIQETTYEEDDACLAQLDNPWCLDFSGVNGILEEFAVEHPGFAIYFAGRSNGHLELHHTGSGWYPDREEDYKKWPWEDLRDLFYLVWDFDQTCQAAVDAFVDFATNWEVVTE